MEKENTKPKSNKNIIISQIWKKKFNLIGKEAVKNNIELMLQEKKILTLIERR